MSEEITGPFNILEFVETVESEYKYPTDNDDQFRGHAIMLCRIVRELGDLNASLRESVATLELTLATKRRQLAESMDLTDAAQERAAAIIIERDAWREKAVLLTQTLQSIRDTGHDPRLDIGDVSDGDPRPVWQEWAKSVGAPTAEEYEAERARDEKDCAD